MHINKLKCYLAQSNLKSCIKFCVNLFKFCVRFSDYILHHVQQLAQQQNAICLQKSLVHSMLYYPPINLLPE